MFFECIGACRDTQKFFAMDQCVALLAREGSKRQGGAAVVAVADGFVVSAGHDGPFEVVLGRGRRRRCGSGKRAEDIDFGASRKAPGNVHTDEKNDEAERAVEGTSEFEKRRGQT